MFVILLASMLTLQGYSGQFQEIHQNIKSITINPLAKLEALEDKIPLSLASLSVNEREQLVDQLQTLKKELCKRPGAGLLVLPIMAPMFFGIKSWFHYHEGRALATGPLTWQWLDGGKATAAFMHNFFNFVISLFGTILIQTEYRDSVASLFSKERKIEIRINRMIEILKHA